MDRAVILWWDTEIRFRAPNGVVSAHTLGEREDPIEAILDLAARSETLAAVRIIYHPASLDIHPVACPPASRARLRAVFASDYPALNLPQAVWSVEPPRRSLDGSGHTTILYLDNRSRLRRLVEVFSQRGISVEGVWPLLTLVENTPPCNEGEFLTVVAIGDRSLVACASPAGSRYFRLQSEGGVEQKAASDINAALSLFDGATLPPGLLLIEREAPPSSLRDSVRELALNEIRVADFLGGAHHLRCGGFSDFLPRAPFFARRAVLARIAAAAGLVLMLGAAWVVHDSRERAELARHHQAASLAEHAELQRLVETHRAIKARIDELGRELSLVESNPPPHAKLLLALAHATPSAISLEGVSITGSDFTIKGRILDGIGTAHSSLTGFIQALGAPDAPWHLADPPPPGLLQGMVNVLNPPSVVPSAVFTIHGAFLSSDQSSPPHA
jgi:hypothetical protein